MTNAQIIAAVVEWFRDGLPWLEHDYSYVPAAKPGAIPDVIVSVENDDEGLGSNFAEFPFGAIQQRTLRVHRLGFSIMADNEDPAAAAALLESIPDELRPLIRGDATLGGRLNPGTMASPFITFDFTQPFVRYEDGTKGREVVGSLSVGQLI